jgi:hypothetical protein
LNMNIDLKDTQKLGDLILKKTGFVNPALQTMISTTNDT